MTNLLSRLRDEYRESLDKSTKYTLSKEVVIEVLEKKEFWLDLTLQECDLILAVIRDKTFTKTEQIITLFNETDVVC